MTHQELQSYLFYRPALLLPITLQLLYLLACHMKELIDEMEKEKVNPTKPCLLQHKHLLATQSISNNFIIMLTRKN